MYHIHKTQAHAILATVLVVAMVLSYIGLDAVQRLMAAQEQVWVNRAPMVTEVDRVASEALWWSESSNAVITAYLNDEHERAIQEIQAQDDRLHNFIGIGQ